MDARDAFLLEHARLHSRAITPDVDVSFEDGVCEGLTPDQLRARPLGLNSIAWILWHVTRLEDLVVNAIVRGEPEVFDRQAWAGRLQIETRLIGTEMRDAETAELSRAVDLDALRAYRRSVGGETRSWAASADFASLDEPPDVAARLAGRPDPLGRRARWLIEFWQGMTAHALLTLPVVGHGHIHIGEARVTRGRLGEVP